MFFKNNYKTGITNSFSGSMAASRSRRANAGCRMKEVMEKGDNDPFYASLYGGFYDDEDDKVGNHHPSLS